MRFSDSFILKMKKLYRIFTVAFAIMMFGSCSKEQVGDPYMLFEIHGKVVDAEGNPINGIQVSSGLSDVQTTNVNGSFEFYGRSAPSTLAVLTFEDKDGDKNGGEFVTLSKDISLNQKSPGTETGNYKGTYFAGDVVVVLLKKDEQITTPGSGLIPLSALR